MKKVLFIAIFMAFVSNDRIHAQTIFISAGRGIVSNSSFSKNNPATVPVFIGLNIFQNRILNFSSSLGYSKSKFNYSPDFSSAYLRFSNYGDVNIILNKNDDKFPFSDAAFLGVGVHLSLKLSDSEMENLNVKRVSWGPLFRYGIKIDFSKVSFSVSHNIFFNIDGVGNIDYLKIPGTYGMILAGIGYNLK